MARGIGGLRLVVLALATVGLGTGCETTDAPATLLGGSTQHQRPVRDTLRQPLEKVGQRPPRINPANKAEEVDSSQLPKELNLVTLPPYTVEAPDILLIDAQRLIPLPPYRVEPLDSLYLFAPGAPQTNPVDGLYPVDPDGTINLGPSYGGQLNVAGLTVTEIEALVRKRLEKELAKPDVSVSLAQSRGVQQVRGEHLVRPDGTVSLGLYGAVYVAGMTLPQVKQAIEQHLSRYLLKPEVSVDVYAYNSKFYYVITDFAGSGEQVARLPSTGKETVLDSIALVGGLSPVSSKRIWVARPAPDGVGDQILPVDWRGITRRGSTKTNYQLLPGDRVFVMGQPLTKVDTVMGRMLAPAERALGVTLLGATASQTIQGNGFFGGND
jgi:polysaccharide export outer membrane protein